MPRKSQLTAAPPFEVEAAIRRLGADLRIARVRRRLTAQDLASKLGVERHVVGDAERGKPTTSIAVYAGLLWALRLLPQLDAVADPARDQEGHALAIASEPKRVRHGGGLDNDF